MHYSRHIRVNFPCKPNPTVNIYKTIHMLRNSTPRFAAVDPKSYMVSPYSVWDLIPAAFTCPWDIQRIGRLGDGGKWACGMVKYLGISSWKDIHARPCVIYSFGVRDESTFEEEMLQRTECGVWGYDPAVSKVCQITT